MGVRPKQHAQVQGYLILRLISLVHRVAGGGKTAPVHVIYSNLRPNGLACPQHHGTGPESVRCLVIVSRSRVTFEPKSAREIHHISVL